MSYIAVTLNHARAIQAWAQSNNAEAHLDMKTFELEVRARNRYFTLFPQFLARVNGRFSHASTLSNEASGFIGWLPYRPLQWSLSDDKLVFKHFAADHGLPTPSMWESAEKAEADYVVKRSIGSFGYELYGPYRANESPPVQVSPSGRGTLYAEQFIVGRNLKVWFWGGQAFYAHLHPYPSIVGDAVSTVSTLIKQRLATMGLSLDESPDMMVMRAALAYQKIRLEDVLPEGSTAWMDYRYGRRYAIEALTAKTDNALPQMTDSVHAQLAKTGGALAEELKKQFSAPVLYSLDGVIDANGEVWWLEMNSNPILPPDGYSSILNTLFGKREQT